MALAITITYFSRRNSTSASKLRETKNNNKSDQNRRRDPKKRGKQYKKEDKKYKKVKERESALSFVLFLPDALQICTARSVLHVVVHQLLRGPELERAPPVLLESVGS